MALTSKSSVSNLIVTAYDQLVEMGLRSEPMFRRFASKRPGKVTNPGDTLVFQIHNDLDRVTSPLNELIDVDPVVMKQTQKVQVTVNEWGNAVDRTERAALETLSAIDPAIADQLAFNQIDTLDYQVYKILTAPAAGRSGTGTTNETVVNGTDKVYGATKTLQAADIRKAVAKLRGAKVTSQDGGPFPALLHPDVSYDIRTEAAGSGANVWQMPHTYTEAGVGANWTGEVGVYEGAKFIESPRMEKIAAGSARTVNNKALTTNVATLTTTVNHGLAVGDVVTVALSPADPVFDGTQTVTAVTANTFSYAKTNANVVSVAAAGTAEPLTHKVLILGKQAMLEVVTYEPKTEIGPVVDRLNRFRSVGWKALLGWNIYRPEARYMLSVQSSI